MARNSADTMEAVAPEVDALQQGVGQSLAGKAAGDTKDAVAEDDQDGDD